VVSFLYPTSDTSETGSPLAFLSLKGRTAAAEHLAEILESQGIRVSSIHFGPSAQDFKGRSRKNHDLNRYVEAFIDSLII